VPKPTERPPEEWKSAGEPMTDSQASFLKRLTTDAGEEFDATLSKAAASRRIDELLNKGKGGSASATSTRRPRKAAAARPKKATAPGGMSEAQSAYLQELAEEEGGAFDPDLTKEEGARRIGELLVKQMARRSPTEPPF
jgi:ribosomal protein L12E/L44/L45/RPP1/RPP2